MPDKSGLIVKNLEFSLDSTLLAIHCVDPVNGGECLMVFIRSNWKWFSKQTIPLEGKLSIFKWMFNKKH